MKVASNNGQISANLKQRLGRKGERAARRHLKKQGYRFLASNYATDRGEVDLIMQQDRTIVFVEVKTRQEESFATGEDAVNWGKQIRIEAAARHFINKHQLHDFPLRFDVVAIAMPESGKPNVRHYESAFLPCRQK